MNKDKELYRVFLGSFIEDNVFFDSLHQYQSKIENTPAYKIRWGKDPNVHMTWKFLGEITEKRINKIICALETNIKEFKPMTLSFNQLETWPKAISPRQLVLSGFDLNNNIDYNFKLLEKTLTDIGFKPEKRKFKPHITLGRFKIKGKLQEPIILPEAQHLKINDFNLSKIMLTKSDLLPEGPKYTIIKTFNV